MDIFEQLDLFDITFTGELGDELDFNELRARENFDLWGASFDLPLAWFLAEELMNVTGDALLQPGPSQANAEGSSIPATTAIAASHSDPANL